jgi:hypothetical protein
MGDFILIVGVVDVFLCIVALCLLLFENCHSNNKETLYQQRLSKKYIFYLTLMIAMFIRGLFLILSNYNLLKNLSLNMIWILLGDMAFFIVYCSTVVIYDNIHYKLKAESDYRINSYEYMRSIRPYTVVLTMFLTTMFIVNCILFILFNHRVLGSEHLIIFSLVDLSILTFLYMVLTIYFIVRCIQIIILRMEYGSLQSLSFKKWRVGILTVGVFLISICYLGRTVFNFYDLITWKKHFSYPVNESIQIYMYLLLETLPMVVFLIFLTKIRKDLLDVVKSKLRLRRN